MIRYVIYLPSNRPGEFEFFESNQTNWTRKLEIAKKEVESLIYDQMHSVSPPYTREEALKGIGKPVIYELNIKRIKY